MQKLELTPYHGQQLVDFEAPTNTKVVEKVEPTLDEVKHAYQDTVLEVNLTRARVKLDM